MKSLFLLLVLQMAVRLVCAQTNTVLVGQTTVSITPLVKHLDTPWEICWGADNYLWVSERPGRISRVNPETGTLKRVLKIQDVAEEGEGGILGMTLHPDFLTSPYVYLVYTHRVSNRLKETLVRYTYQPKEDTLTAPLELLTVAASQYHNGSRVMFLADQSLLMTTGDAQNQSTPQDATSLNGKILRLRPDGTAPADNPQPGQLLYTLGHRNPQGLTRNPTGRIYSSEHGPDSNDEVNLIEPGRNYGWPNVMGFCDLPAETAFCAEKNVKEPLFAWTPTLAVAGLAYYNHPAIPEWSNSLLLNSLKAGQFLQLPLQADGLSLRANPVVVFTKTYGRLRSVCVAPDGRVFLGTSNQDGATTPSADDDQLLVLENKAYVPTAVRKPQAMLEVWPNPAKTHLQLQLPQPLAQAVPVTIQDAMGRPVRQETLPPGHTSHIVSLVGLARGWYVVRVQTPQQELVRRLVLE